MRKKELLIVVAVIIVVSGVTGTLVYKNKNSDRGASMDHSKMSMASAPSINYSVNLMSGKTYTGSSPVTLHFDVEQNGKILKDFVLDSTKLMHLIVVRKDRTNFQHVHPSYDSSTGMFTMDNFKFPTDGQYRLYANFATTNAKKDAMGMIETEAPFQDVSVGDISKEAIQPLGDDRLTSNVDGFATSIIELPGGDTPSTSGQPIFYAGQDARLTIEINKNATAFKNLQEYLGALGHIVILGPNLEFIHAHPLLGDVNDQIGLIIFMVTFPITGQYKLYLQTQANDTVSTFDYNLTVKELPKASKSSNSMNSMQMSH